MNALVDGGAAPKLNASFGGASGLAGAPKLNGFAAGAGAGAAGKAKGFDAAGALGAAAGALLSSFATRAR